MRNIGDISTWLRLILDSDQCINSYGSRTTCSSGELTQDGVCYKDTFSACYKLTCASESDKRRVFQYWIGAPMDPAGMGPPATSMIPLLNAVKSGNEVILNVPSPGGVPVID